MAGEKYCQWDGAKLNPDGSCASCINYRHTIENKKGRIEGFDARKKPRGIDLYNERVTGVVRRKARSITA